MTKMDTLMQRIKNTIRVLLFGFVAFLVLESCHRSTEVQTKPIENFSIQLMGNRNEDHRIFRSDDEI